MMAKMNAAGALAKSSWRLVLPAVLLFSACQNTRPPVDDQAITKSVKARLSSAFGRIEDKQISQFDRGADGQTITYISVSSTAGVVTLSGEVASKKIKAKAAEIARSVPRVVRVNNNLSLAPGYSDDALGDRPK